MNKTSRGFTLIELLVVIAIIGLLSSVILASLSTARKKASDVAIRANLRTIQTQAQIYFSDHNNYVNMFVDNTIKAAFADAHAQSPNGNTDYSVSGSGKKYSVVASLATDLTKYWCIDSSGANILATDRISSLMSSRCQ